MRPDQGSGIPNRRFVPNATKGYSVPLDFTRSAQPEGLIRIRSFRGAVCVKWTLGAHSFASGRTKGVRMVAIITRDELKQKLDRHENIVLLETLALPAYEAEHIPGALNLPPDQVRELAPRVAPDRNAEIIVYCGSPT
jgi:hypothetical protein